MSDVILVCGGTGRQGHAVAMSLLQKQQKIRILTRNISSQTQQEKLKYFKNLGAEIVQADMTDEHSLQKALQGVARVFLMTTPYEAGVELEVQQGITTIDAAKKSNIEQLVFSSVGSTNKNSGVPHFESKWKIEQYLYQSKIPSTVIRPVAFMDEMAPPAILSDIQNNILTLPLTPGRKFQTIAIRDIGEFAAAALTQSSFIGQKIDIAGEELTPEGYTDIISKYMNKPLRYQQMPDSQLESTFGHDLALMFRWFNRVGYDVNIAELKKQYGLALTSFKKLVTENLKV
ncbi:MAG: NmrA/HSCARG family protein [Taibaiella sp.]|jgi:uncharacterized protein YbjT (DUF2867 family)